MCGRYTITESAAQMAERFRAEMLDANWAPRYNAAPTQLLPVVIQEGGRRIVLMRWGLIPSWAKDASIGHKMINARADAVMTKPSFRLSIRRRRCLVPADGFYEWMKHKGGKTPMHVSTGPRRMFAFAGIWDRWTSPNGAEVLTFSIITTDAIDSIRPLHDRMPLIVPRELEDAWLDSTLDDAGIEKILTESIAAPLRTQAVSNLVNSPAFDDASLLEPATEAVNDSVTPVATQSYLFPMERPE